MQYFPCYCGTILSGRNLFPSLLQVRTFNRRLNPTLGRKAVYGNPPHRPGGQGCLTSGSSEATPRCQVTAVHSQTRTLWTDAGPLLREHAGDNAPVDSDCQMLSVRELSDTGQQGEVFITELFARSSPLSLPSRRYAVKRVVQFLDQFLSEESSSGKGAFLGEKDYGNSNQGNKGS